MSALHDFAREAGLVIDWKDAAGRPQRVSDESLTAILDALELPAGNDRAIEESRARLREQSVEGAEALLTAEVGEAAALPRAFGSEGLAQLQFESGERCDFRLEDGVPAIAVPGYHRLEIGDRSVRLAVAPRRGFALREATGGRKAWGMAVQIPSLRDRRGEAFGDFGALGAFAEQAARRGADALAVSPCHALFPADPSSFSPYAPSSRLFLNVLLADPSLLGDAAMDPGGGELIDWQAAIPERMRRLRNLYEDCGESTRGQVEAFRQEGGAELELHARFDALHAHFFPELGSHGWCDWPERYHDAQGPAVAEFARAHDGEVAFYIFLQWLADRSLAAAQAAGRDNGMALGLIADMAVGVDQGGSQAWGRPDALLSGLSVGAPPDILGPDGQNWGVTSFSPQGLKRTGFTDFISTIGVALRHAGGIRIDHAMGLRRLWVVPQGAGPADGAYLSYPETEMMRLLALESARSRAIVVGEDLGTVPEGFQPQMERHGFLGMRVLWFERTGDEDFLPSGEWSECAAAMTSTHDLPTVAGWWQERDIDWGRKLGRTSSFASEAEEREARGADRTRLWRACSEAGTAEGAEPARGAPDEAVTAALNLVGKSACELAILPVEDVLGLPEQPNLPGTIDEHPNWRRRLPGEAETLLESAEVGRRLERLNRARPR